MTGTPGKKITKQWRQIKHFGGSTVNEETGKDYTVRDLKLKRIYRNVKIKDVIVICGCATQTAYDAISNKSLVFKRFLITV